MRRTYPTLEAPVVSVNGPRPLTLFRFPLHSPWFELDDKNWVGLTVYGAATLERRARYQTTSVPTSVAPVGDNLVIGGDATLSVVAPACSLSMMP